MLIQQQQQQQMSAHQKSYKKSDGNLGKTMNLTNANQFYDDLEPQIQPS